MPSGRNIPGSGDMPADMRVLLIDDDPAHARHVAALLGTLDSPGIVLECAGGLADASERLAGHPPDVILLDLALSEAPGLDGLLRVRAESSAPIVVLAGNRQCELGERALRHGAHAHLQKDQLDPATLLRALERASATHSWILGPSLGIGDGELTQEPASLSQIECSNDDFGGGAAAQVLGSEVPLGDDAVERQAEGRVARRPAHSTRRSEGTSEAIGRPYEAIVEDVTERHAVEKKLHQAHKMEAVGRLAGGLAHDFNNMLGVIIGYSDLLLDQIAPGDPSRGQLQEIRKAGDRAASLARQFLAFSREESPEPRILSLNTVVTDLERMLRRLIREDIELHTFLAPSVGQIKSDLGQLEQVIINLVVNARDAMPHGGKLILETFNVDLNEVYALHHPPLVPGPYVCLAVADTGVGMSAETQEHIFEPFFTTKPKDHGTGLGLATVYGVVKKNNGYVWVYSEPGMGATFKVYLPRVGGLAELSSGARQAAAMPRRSETILLVEDEPALRTVTSAMLERGGYFVLEAANAAEAMAVAEEHAGQIDLLLTDVIMPGMNGPALAAKMARARPQIKVLFISGYTGSYVAHRGLIEESSLLLQKPFTPEVLLRKLQEILESLHRVEAVLETEAHRE